MMTLHSLTKELLSARFEYSPNRDEAIDKMVRAWAHKQAEWLKSIRQSAPKSFHDGDIDQAFQLEPETLEEKFKAIRQKHDYKHPSPKDFWDAVCKDFAQAAKEHFNNQPSPRTVNCSIQQKINDQTS